MKPSESSFPRAEESLDPEDWEAFRRLAHRMVDDTLDHLAAVRERPVWQPLPDEVTRRLDEPIPFEPQGAEAVYQQFRRDVLPYPNGNTHPRFWGWVMGNGTPLGMMADMLAAGMNPHLASGDQAPVQVERRVIAWCAELMGFPRGTSGLLVSGGSVANLVGLTVARNAKAGFDVRRIGLQQPALPRLVLYGSVETHSCVQKAAEMLGLGNEAYRRIPVDAEFRIDLAALHAAIRADRALGLRPFCVVGSAGTVNTGATDDLAGLADIAQKEHLWFHVDGAFGAFAAIVPSLRDKLAGLERADSLAIDLHKWMYLPFEVGCILVRDPEAHEATFGLTPAYLAAASRGLLRNGNRFSDLGPQLTRGFRALKVWMSLKGHGVRAFARLIEQNVAQASYLARRIESEPELELMAPVPLNVVCFRFLPSGLDPAALDALNQELLIRIQESGVAVPSSTLIGERFALRVAITNHRSRREDFDLLVDTALRIGRSLTPSFPPSPMSVSR